jgi:hypothetical protein
VAAYKRDGVLPAKEDVRGWHYMQTRMFLRLMPTRIPTEDCRILQALFNLKPDGNIRLLFEFYRICIRSGYMEVLPGIERYVEKVGRHAFLVPVIRCMAETEWTKQMVRPLFDRVRSRHHPITVANVERVLDEAGV